MRIPHCQAKSEEYSSITEKKISNYVPHSTKRRAAPMSRPVNWQISDRYSGECSPQVISAVFAQAHGWAWHIPVRFGSNSSDGSSCLNHRHVPQVGGGALRAARTRARTSSFVTDAIRSDTRTLLASSASIRLSCSHSHVLSLPHPTHSVSERWSTRCARSTTFNS